MRKLIALFAGLTLLTAPVFAKDFEFPKQCQNYEERTIFPYDKLVQKDGEKFLETHYYLNDGKIEVIETNRTTPDKEFGGVNVIQPPCQITCLTTNKFYTKGSCQKI